MDIVLSLDGEERTVSSDDLKLPDGFGLMDTANVVSREDLKENYVLKANFDRRFKTWVPRDRAAEDEEVRQAIIASLPPTPDLESAKQQWTETEKAPLQKKLGELIGKLTRNEVRDAALELFDERFVARPEPNKPSYIEAMFEGAFAYDSDLGYTVAVDGEGHPIASANPTALRPYATPQEYLGVRAAKDQALAPFLRLDPKNDGGSGHRRSGSNNAPFPVKSKSEFKSIKEKTDFIKEHGFDAYNALPA